MVDVDFGRVFDVLPTPHLLVDASLFVVDANAAFLTVARSTRAELMGRPLAAVFPSGGSAGGGLSATVESFRRARETGLPDTLPVDRHDIAGPGGGQPVERTWSHIVVPVRDEGGAVTHLVQRLDNLTDHVTASVLTEVALGLAMARDLDELTDTVVTQGVEALGALGGAIAVRHGDNIRLAITDSLGEVTQRDYHEVSLDNPLPAPRCVSTGKVILLPDRATTLAWPAMPDVVAASGCDAWAFFPLRDGDRVIGSLNLGWAADQDFTAARLLDLETLAGRCGRALARIQARDSEQSQAAAALRMAEALQRHLLTEPQSSGGLDIAVRYRPASAQAQVGGDWYDSFAAPDGATCLVIGDVTGHDQHAAAIMAQVRNLLRGVAYTVVTPPAGILIALDKALRDIHVPGLASVVFARVEQTPERAGHRVLQWSNAGHPPPLLLTPGRPAEYVGRDSDELLLGIDPDTPRTDLTQPLEPGTTVLLYTDGLIERRGVHLDEGLAWLRQTVTELSHRNLDDLLDTLLNRVGAAADDDIALLAMRVLEL